MADTTVPTTLPQNNNFGFADGAQFGISGQALNNQAITSLAQLQPNATNNTYSGFVPPNTNTPVPTSQIASAPLNIPPAMPSPDENGSNLMAGIVASTNMAQSGGSDTPSLDAATGLNTAITGDYSQDLGYQAANNQLQQSEASYAQNINSMPSSADLLNQAQGVDYTGFGSAQSNATTVKNLTTQLASMTAQYNNSIAQTETNGIDSGTPALIYQGAQAAQQRQASIQTAGVAAQLQAAQGNYTAAENYATQAANLKFQDAQTKLDNQSKFIALNQDNLSNAEKVAVSKMQAQQTLLQTQLDRQKTLFGLGLQLGVKQPYFSVGSTIIRASDGYQFKSAEEAAAAGVDTQNLSNVQQIDPSQLSTKFVVTGQDSFGTPTYGFVNEAKNTVVPVAPTTGDYTATGNSLTSTSPDPSKVIGGYDFTNYATDPNWGTKVSTDLAKVPDLSLGNGQEGPQTSQQSAQTLDAYIQSVAKGSPITGQMILTAAQQYGVDPRVMTAIMQNESSFGTKGEAVSTHNPGNVGNTDSGATKDQGDWQSGVNAVASNMAQRSTSSSSPAGTGSSGSGNGLDFTQYGLLANTNFNPASTVDSLAQKYLDSYIKSGSVPTASTLGRSIKPQAMAQIDSRARDLYHQATGGSMPTPAVIKGAQNNIVNNNQLANNLQIQEQTVAANVDFSIQNMKKNNLDSQSFQPLSNLINTIQALNSDPATGQLIAQNTTIQNELGSLLAVKNASGTTVYDKMASAGIISKNDTPQEVQTKVSALMTEAGNFANSLNIANATQYKITDPFLQDPDNPIVQYAQSKGIDLQAALKAGYTYDTLIKAMQSGQ